MAKKEEDRSPTFDERFRGIREISLKKQGASYKPIYGAPVKRKSIYEKSRGRMED